MPSRTSSPARSAARLSRTEDAASTCSALPQAQPAAEGHSIARIAVLPAPRGRAQTALQVGSADNAFEREADRVASQVMGTPDSALQAPIAREADEEEMQMKRDASSGIAREADEEEMQMKRDPEAPGISREADEEEMQMQRDDSVARSGEDMMGSFEAGGEVEGGIGAKRGGGNALGNEVRSFMEPRFGADFSQVRVHDDAASDGLNRAVGAKAFATGSDVFFRKGEYQPNSSAGRQLLAHELTHVVQQGGAGVSAKRKK